MAKQIISRSTATPGFLGLIIDLSGSTAHDGIFNSILSALYQILDMLVTRNTVMDKVKDRMHVAVVGYNSRVYPLFQGTLTELDDFLVNYTRDDFLQDRPEVKPQGLTHMGDAVAYMADLASQFVDGQRSKGVAVPQAVVMHIGDGFPEERNRTDEEARRHFSEEAQRIMQIKCDDGNLLFFNIHFNPGSERPETVMPATTDRISDEDVRLLYDNSSVIPDDWISYARAQGFDTAVTGSRGMMSNTREPAQLLRFMSWGTLTAPARVRETDIDDNV